jgi:hypothetical protein
VIEVVTIGTPWLGDPTYLAADGASARLSQRQPGAPPRNRRQHVGQHAGINAPLPRADTRAIHASQQGTP